MTVGITEDYIQQVRTLLDLWVPNRKMFRVNEMQKLVGKLARLGEGAPWIFKLMSHLYTSLAFALKSNTEFLEKSSSGFRDLVKQIMNKTFSGKISDHQRHLNYAMKQAAKMVNKHGQQYLVNTTMRDELNFIKKALSDETQRYQLCHYDVIVDRTMRNHSHVGESLGRGVCASYITVCTYLRTYVTHF
jgi:hypothetical protein